MGFLDFIKSLFGNNKKNAKLIVDDLSKDYGDAKPLEVALYDGDTPLVEREIVININNKDYNRRTDKDGIARLNINLGVGEYKVLYTFNGDDEYNKVTAHGMVNVNGKMITNDLSMSYHDGSMFNVKITDKNNNPLDNVKVEFNINNNTYNRMTKNGGVASLGINLNPGDYIIESKAGGIKSRNNIHINRMATRMEGTDINKTASESSVYQCAIYDVKNGNRVIGDVDITVNGKTYRRHTGIDGLAKLNINLGKGEYNINSKFAGDIFYTGSSVDNKVKVTDDPAPQPLELNDYITEQGAGKLGQRTGYTCGPHSLMQCIYRLTGIELSEMELASACGTTSAGTGHDGLATGLAWFNRRYGYNLKMTWKNFSEVGFDGLQEAYENGAVFCHLLYRDEWGHYEVPLISSSDPMRILNSLGDSCGGGYCGYIENRSQSTQRRYIGGISQKSVCIITR